jgi:ABC-type ATPase involved in cell division
VVTQNNTLDMQLTVTENLEFRSRFFGLRPREATRRAGQLIDAFGLGDRRTAMATTPTMTPRPVTPGAPGRPGRAPHRASPP